MDNEIKEILDRLNYIVFNEIIDYGEELNLNECKLLLDYITNLQEENEYLNNELNNMTDYAKGLEQENEELKKKLDRRYYKNEYERIKEENERLKEIIENLTTMTVCNDRKQIKNTAQYKLEDYKSRCEKASECIKKDTRWFDSEYVRVYGELCDCAGAKGDRLEVMVNPSNALNILQNGSEEK